MSNEQKTDKKVDKIFPATVIRVIDASHLAINRGSTQDIAIGQRVLLYEVSEEEITDPDTGKKLGRLELPKGTGKIIHVQEEMSIIESDRKKAAQKTKHIRRGSPLWGYGESEEEIITPSDELLPFDRPKEGDKIKPV